MHKLVGQVYIMWLAFMAFLLLSWPEAEVELVTSMAIMALGYVIISTSLKERE